VRKQRHRAQADANHNEHQGYLDQHSDYGGQSCAGGCTPTEGRERKVYTLTARGRGAFEVAVDAWQEVTGYILKAVQVPQEGR